MYIGPWQEYRLAKIQDEAIQRLRMEWELKLTAQLPTADKQQIQDLMDPLVAKLPKLLLAKPPTHQDIYRRVHRRAVGGTSKPTADPSNVSTKISEKYKDDDHREEEQEEEDEEQEKEKEKRGSNQKSHEDAPTTKRPSSSSTSDSVDGEATANDGMTKTRSKSRSRAKTRDKAAKMSGKSSKQEPSALQKRKQMFASWIQHAAHAPCDRNNKPSTCPASTSGELEALEDPRTLSCHTDELKASSTAGSTLPPIHSVHQLEQMQGQQQQQPHHHRRVHERARQQEERSGVQLPPFDTLEHASPSTVQSSEQQLETEPSSLVVESASTAQEPEIDLDASLDEDEVNQLLNWTQELAVPP